MLKNMKIGTKLIGGFLVVAFITLIVGLVGLRGINTMGKETDDILFTEMPISDAVMEMKYQIIVAQDIMASVMLENEYDQLAQLEEQFKKSVKEFDKYSEGILNGYSSQEMTIKATTNEKVREMVKKIEDQHKQFETLAGEIIRIQKKVLSQGTKALTSDEQKLHDLMVDMDGAGGTAAELAVAAELEMGKVMDLSMKQADSAQSTSQTMTLIFTVLGFVLSFIIGFFLSRSISRPLAKISDAAKSIAGGNVNVELHSDSKDEIGDLTNSIKSIVDVLTNMTKETSDLTASVIEGRIEKRGESQKFEGLYQKLLEGFNATLDAMVGYIEKVPAPMMIIDNDYSIRYMNEAGVKLLKSTKSQLVGSKCYNHFKTGDCGTGKCACGRAMSEGRIANSETDAHPVGMDLEISYTGVPIKDQSGKTVGAFELVTDQTDIKKAQKLSQKISNYQSEAVSVVSKALEKLSQGDLNVNVEVGKGDGDTSQVRDNFLIITKAINQTTEAVKQMTGDVNYLTQAALEGKLSTRADYKKHHGEYMNIVQGINNILDAVIIPMNETAAVLERIAAKDLTTRMKGDYKGDLAKIKEALNTASDNLEKAMQQVAIGAEQVASASVQVSTGAQSLSQGTSEQASSLEEVSSSLQEMSSMTKQNVSNAKEAKGVAEQTRESSDKGMESMSKLSGAINKIKASSDSTAKIVKTIDEIAFQTNLLALNAAVEAARAGDAGKGFAVVAEEVRNLAMRSAEAAKNTANLIEEAVKNSENGVVINAEVLKNFQEINERANKVSQVVAEIAAASEQQDQGIGQVNKAVEQMNQVTQQNAANAEESASAAEEMSSQAEEMRSMVAGFQLTASGEFTQALKAGSQTGHMLHNLAMGKKGGKAAAGIQPDPRKIIPLDEKDHSILKTF